MRETDEVDQYLVGALLAIPWQVIQRRVDEALAAEGFTDYRPSFAALFQWLGPEGNRSTELAQRAGVTKQSIAELVDKMERRGYVERVPDPTDRRAKLVRRSERGWRVNQTARRVVEQVQQEWQGKMGEEDFAQLQEQLRRLVRLLDEPGGVAGHPRTMSGSQARDAAHQEGLR